MPAPEAGVIGEVKVKVGDKVSEGALILTARRRAPRRRPRPPQRRPRPPVGSPRRRRPPPARPRPTSNATSWCSAPAPAATPPPSAPPISARRSCWSNAGATLGGVCLNVGCIPSKALLHAAKVIDEAAEFGEHGADFAAPHVDLDKLRGWKESVVKRLTGGLTTLARQRKVTVVTGDGEVRLGQHDRGRDRRGDARPSRFNNAIIAAGSEPVAPGFIPQTIPRIMDSTGALEIANIPKRLLVLGGGIIGLEMATVYHALGSKITVVELMDQLIPGADNDIVAPLAKRIGRRYEKILLKTKVAAVEAKPDGLHVATSRARAATTRDVFDAMLVSVGRRPNGAAIGAEAAGVRVDERGFIAVDRQMRTNVPHIFAIGDIVGQPMLAHKATHEGKVAAEVASGHKSLVRRQGDPLGRLYRSGSRLGRRDRDRGQGQGPQIRQGGVPLGGERTLAVARPRRGPDQDAVGRSERPADRLRHRRPQRRRPDRRGDAGHRDGRDAEDIGLTIHPHPTLSETFAFSAEALRGR